MPGKRPGDRAARTAEAGAARPGPSLTARALGYLARREHSRAELTRKLAKFAESETDLTRVLDHLERRKFLSDERYAEARVNSLAGRYGGRRLAHELREKGVSDTVASEALRRVHDAEFARARAVWAKRFATPAADPLERAKQMRFLNARGFSFDIIRRVVGGSDQ